jgi:hypothetical protein
MQRYRFLSDIDRKQALHFSEKQKAFFLLEKRLFIIAFSFKF